MARYTEKEDEVIRRMWLEQGHTMLEIALALKRTRSSVSSRLNTLKLLGKGKRNKFNRWQTKTAAQIMERRTMRKEARRRKRFTPVKKDRGLGHREVEAHAPEDAVPLLDLEHDMCRWAYGDRDFLFCGEPVKQGTAWCPTHYAVVYNREGEYDEQQS